MQIDKKKLIEAISKSTFGTGTLSQAARIHPDKLQRLIGSGEGEESLVKSLEGLLNTEISPQTEQRSDKELLEILKENTVEELKEMATDDIAERLVWLESKRKRPRKTLIQYFAEVGNASTQS